MCRRIAPDCAHCNTVPENYQDGQPFPAGVRVALFQSAVPLEALQFLPRQQKWTAVEAFSCRPASQSLVAWTQDVVCDTLVGNQPCLVEFFGMSFFQATTLFGGWTDRVAFGLAVAAMILAPLGMYL